MEGLRPVLTFRKKILLIVALAVILAFGVSWWLLYGVIRNGVVRQSALELSRQTGILESSLREGGMPRYERDLGRWKGVLRGRFTLVDSRGAVLADTEGDPAFMDNHLSRPEVKDALAHGEGSSLRYSSTTNTYYLYYALRTAVDGNAAVIRSALPLERLTSVFRETRDRFVLYLLIGAVFIVAFGTMLVRLIFRPLDRIVEAAGKISRQEEARFPLMAEPELQRLSSALDGMSARLRGALGELRAEREDLSRIVTALPVGVILLDGDRRIRYVNSAAEDLLSFRHSLSQGVSAERAFSSGDLFSLVDAADAGREECRFLETAGPAKRYLRACSRKTATGVLLVIADLTEEKRLEQSRRDFIADAGHEFQTPLTVIRAAAEYLLDEAVQRENHDSVKYLSTIISQQERMTRLVDDLLLLSRMESEPPLQNAGDADLVPLVMAVAEECRKHPFASGIEIGADVPSSAPAFVRSGDISRALGNLVENALKYVREKFGDREGGRVSLSLGERDGFWSISIRDNGVGVPEGWESAIFDRFRRGDNHRARGEWGKGGYGLGLAIAKRICLAAGGDLFCHPSWDGAHFEMTIPKKKA